MCQDLDVTLDRDGCDEAVHRPAYGTTSGSTARKEARSVLVGLGVDRLEPKARRQKLLQLGRVPFVADPLQDLLNHDTRDEQ